MGGGEDEHNSQDKGLFSNLAGFAAGHYRPQGPQHGGYSPYGYSHPPPAGYSPSGYPPPGGYPPQSYPPPGGYPPHSYPPPGGYPPHSYPPPGGYPPSGYPPAGYPPGHGGFGTGTLLAGGAAAAAAVYGAHYIAHGHGMFKHGKFGGMFGRHKGKFKRWK